MSRVIVYFSKSGNTRCGAKMLAETLSIPLVELMEAQPGTAAGASQKKASVLQGSPWDEIAGYDEIFLMSPIWAFSAVPAILAFLEKADLQGKRLWVITFQALPRIMGTRRAHLQIRTLIESRGGTVKEHYGLRGGGMNRFAGGKRIRREVDRALKYLGKE